MKKAIYLALAGMLVLCASCSKESIDEVLSAGNGDATLVIDIKGLPLSNVKAAAYQTDDEKKISQIDIAIYDASGALEWSKHYTEARTSRQVVTGLVAGKKSVGVIANLTVGTMPATLDGFKAVSTDLKDNSRTNLVMSAIVEGTASTNPEAVKVSLARVAAKFTIDGKITTEWEGDAPQSFDITDVYLANVSVASNVVYATSAPSVNLRTSTTVTSDAVYKNLTVAQKQTWTSGSPFNGGVSFYGYPNKDASRTCLMLKALYEGRVCYYPLVIDKEIKNNTLYRIGDIKITCEGVKNPQDVFTKIKILFDIDVADWDYNDLYPEFTF